MDIFRKKKDRVLLIEDDQSLRKALKDAFENAGFSVLEAKEGAAGLTLALAEHPHAIVLDVMLPNMIGTDVLRHIRNDQWGKNVPVLVLTNLIELDIERTAYFEGASGYLIKSDTSPRLIVERIQYLLGT